MNSGVLVAIILIVVIGVIAVFYLTQPVPSKPEKNQSEKPLPSPEEIVNYTPQLPENITVNETNETLPEVNESILEIQLPEEI